MPALIYRCFWEFKYYYRRKLEVNIHLRFPLLKFCVRWWEGHRAWLPSTQQLLRSLRESRGCLDLFWVCSLLW